MANTYPHRYLLHGDETLFMNVAARIEADLRLITVSSYAKNPKIQKVTTALMEFLDSKHESFSYFCGVQTPIALDVLRLFCDRFNITMVDCAYYNPLLLTHEKRQIMQNDWLDDVKEENYVGARIPDVVLVGDQSNPRGRPYRFPFHHDALSSGFLHDVLTNLNTGPLAIFNAYDPESERSLLHCLAVNRDVKFISVGNEADKWLRSRKVEPFGHVSHPSFVKRFQASKKDQYRFCLAQAIWYGGTQLCSNR